MSSTEEEDYGDIADEDLIEILSQPSQTLPSYPSKRRRLNEVSEKEDVAVKPRRKPGGSRGSIISGEDEEDVEKAKKKKYKIHIGVDEVPEAVIVGATQADRMPDSSPYRIRGPIYRKPRTEVPKPPPLSTTPRSAIPESDVARSSGRGPSRDDDLDRELENLPSDAFSPSPDNGTAPKKSIRGGLSSSLGLQRSSFTQQNPSAPQSSFRQTTLFGFRAVEDPPTASQIKKVYDFKVDKPLEPPTHHALDLEALQTWVYPTNLGTIRDYQFSIVRNGLFNNLLVALPTGLGKTFIAATIMLNYFRWTKDAKIVFVAPTKPLVSQQVEACFNIVGIPRSTTTMLTGDQAPDLRAEEWKEKRVFFMTPQTLENDLKYGFADPKSIVLLVVDEAHRATGNYAYVKVVQFLRRFNQSFRILALTATPGASVEAVQEVIDGLEISKVEIRTEESIDIQQFVHQRKIKQVLLDPSEEMVNVMELFSKALQPLVDLLCAQNAYWKRDPMSLTPFGLMQAKKSWLMSEAGKRASPALKGMMMGLFAILASIAHGIKLLHYHGIGPFYAAIKEFRTGVEDGKKAGKYRSQIVESPHFQEMMNRIRLWVSKDDFIGHPKLTHLCDTILNHFLDAGEGRLAHGAPPSSTRVIVFAEYRDSAEDIARILNRHRPMIRASVFVGQADSKRSEGMNQKKQLETINDFKSGQLNVLVATSIGEEGLDIGQVDLIICYDASGSPIRMLQRMGRTGRKRAGNIVLLLMRGKEEESFTKAKDNYEQMQKMISSGARFNFRHDLSARIVPKDVTPVVDKRLITIPVENTQDNSMPEPKRRRSKASKKPPKKFHMPDGVETGFRKASKFSEDGVDVTNFGVTRKTGERDTGQLTPVPSLDSVLLNVADTKKLERCYQTVAGSELQEVNMPDLTSQPVTQRSLGATVNVPHGKYTKRCVRLFNTLANSQRVEDRYVMPYGDQEPTEMSWPSPRLDRPKKFSSVKRKQPRKLPLAISDDESGSETNEYISINRGALKLASSIVDDQSDEEGDDVNESEDPSDDSDTDGDESLKSFVVDDEENINGTSGPHSSLSCTSTPVPQLKTKLFFEPMQFNATQDTNDDDMPDVRDLVGVKTTAVSRIPLDELDTDDNLQPVINRTGKRRRIVDSEDSDE